MATKLAPGSRKGVGHSSSQVSIHAFRGEGDFGDVEPRRTSERAGRSPAAVAFRRSPSRPPRLPVFRLPHIVSIHAFRGEGDFGDDFPRRQFHCTTGVKKRAAHSNRAQPATSNRAARRNAPDDPPHFPPHPPFPAAPCGDSLFREMQTMEMQTMQAYCKHIALACAVNAAYACMQRDAMHA